MARDGRYRIVRKIADGGMAEIFLATQHGAEGFERPVVLKRILATLLTEPQFRNMMVDEAHVAMSLNHSNIAQVLDLGEWKGRYFLVLEFVDGWDLNNLLQRVRAANFPMPAQLALYVVGEVCRALAYAHAKTAGGNHLGIVHRDISPHNVLVSLQGEVKLTDFGIAKATIRREQTGQGIIKGKLAFMSPEQASGMPIDARSDLFSVGTMLYLMTTGVRPFEAPTDLESILRVQQCQFSRPVDANPAIPPQLSEIILRAMQADPAARYQSAEALLIDLEAVQRTVFVPAGQTELKRWLAELGDKDHALPAGRAVATDPTATDTLGQLAGADVIFEATGNEDALARAAALPPPVPVAALQATSVATVIEQTAPRQAPVQRRGLLVGLLLALGTGVAALRLWKKAHTPEPRIKTAGRMSLTGRGAIDASASPSADARPAPRDTTADVVVPSASRSPGPNPDPEEDEDALLKQLEPDLLQKVIGDDTVPASPTRRQATPPADTISVRFPSRPDGAVIRMKSRIFGRAPISLRFKAGITYEIALVKRGYVTTTKRFTVSRKKNQVVAVTLRKKPAPKKSFLRRLFGG